MKGFPHFPQILHVISCEKSKSFLPSVIPIIKNILFFHSVSIKFLLDPGHDHISDQVFLLNLTQISAWLNFMPLPDTFPATGGSCMLGNKDRMSFGRCLLPIIGNYCRCFSFGNEIHRMFSYSFQTFFLDIINVFLLQVKTAPKF